MLRTFNCGFNGGVRFAEREAEARTRLLAWGLSPVLIGELVPTRDRRLPTYGRLR
jgi:hypothetical protein